MNSLRLDHDDRRRIKRLEAVTAPAMLCAAANTLAPRTQDAEIRKLSQHPCAPPLQYGSMTRDRAREFRAYVSQTLATAFWFFVFWHGGWALLRSYEQYQRRLIRDGGIGAYRPRRFLPWRSVSASTWRHRKTRREPPDSGTVQAASGDRRDFRLALLAIGAKSGLMQLSPRPAWKTRSWNRFRAPRYAPIGDHHGRPQA